MTWNQLLKWRIETWLFCVCSSRDETCASFATFSCLVFTYISRLLMCCFFEVAVNGGLLNIASYFFLAFIYLVCILNFNYSFVFWKLYLITIRTFLMFLYVHNFLSLIRKSAPYFILLAWFDLIVYPSQFTMPYCIWTKLEIFPHIDLNFVFTFWKLYFCRT